MIHLLSTNSLSLGHTVQETINRRQAAIDRNRAYLAGWDDFESGSGCRYETHPDAGGYETAYLDGYEEAREYHLNRERSSWASIKGGSPEGNGL